MTEKLTLPSKADPLEPHEPSKPIQPLGNPLIRFLPINLGLYGVAAVVGCVLNPLFEFEHYGTLACLGFSFGQVSLSAIWIAWGNHAWYQRMVESAITLCVAIVSIVILTRLDPPGGDELIYILLIPVIQWLITQTFLWMIRFLWERQIIHESTACNIILPWQYGIRDIMISTTIIAVVLGIGRVLLPMVFTESSTRIPAGEIFLFILLCISNIVLAYTFLFIWLLFRKLIFLVTWSVIGFASICLLEIVAARLFSGSKMDWGFVRAVFLINFMQVIPIAAFAYFLARSGYRIGRVQGSK